MTTDVAIACVYAGVNTPCSITCALDKVDTPRAMRHTAHMGLSEYPPPSATPRKEEPHEESPASFRAVPHRLRTRGQPCLNLHRRLRPPVRPCVRRLTTGPLGGAGTGPLPGAHRHRILVRQEISAATDGQRGTL